MSEPTDEGEWLSLAQVDQMLADGTAQFYNPAEDSDEAFDDAPDSPANSDDCQCAWHRARSKKALEERLGAIEARLTALEEQSEK